MKTILTIFISILFSSVFGIHNLNSQNKSPGRIYLEHIRSTENYQLSIRVLGKVEKRYLPVSGVEVSLYSEEIDKGNLLGTVRTGDDGTGVYTLTDEQLNIAKNKESATYVALIDQSDEFKFKKKEITIQDVQFSVECVVKDSVKSVIARVWEVDSAGIEIPIEGVEMAFFVERPLSPLSMGDDYIETDEAGLASAIYPDDLPGDTAGNIEILVRIVEHDDYGTVEASEIKSWGTPTKFSDRSLKRSLWASGANAPISLLVFINALIASVWGMVLYIIFKVFKIRRIGKNTN